MQLNALEKSSSSLLLLLLLLSIFSNTYTVSVALMISGRCRHLSGRRYQVQMRQSRIHGVVAAQDLLYIHDVVHTGRASRPDDLLLRQCGSRRLEAQPRTDGRRPREEASRGSHRPADGRRRQSRNQRRRCDVARLGYCVIQDVQIAPVADAPRRP